MILRARFSQIDTDKSRWIWADAFDDAVYLS